MNTEDWSQLPVRLETLSLVKISWIDAETIGDTGWQDLADARETIQVVPPTMSTVGFLLGDYPTHVTVTDSLGDKECGHITKIPREMIKEIVRLVHE